MNLRPTIDLKARRRIQRRERTAFERRFKAKPLPVGALVYSQDGRSVYRVAEDGGLRLVKDVPWEDVSARR